MKNYLMIKIFPYKIRSGEGLGVRLAKRGLPVPANGLIIKLDSTRAWRLEKAPKKCSLLCLELAKRSKYFWCGQSLIGVYPDTCFRQSEIGYPRMRRDRLRELYT